MITFKLGFSKYCNSWILGLNGGNLNIILLEFLHIKIGFLGTFVSTMYSGLYK